MAEAVSGFILGIAQASLERTESFTYGIRPITVFVKGQARQQVAIG